MIISQHRLPLERRAVASAKRSQEAWQRGEMIGWRQQVVGDQRVEEVLGRQARCPKNVIAKFLQYSFTTTCSNIDWLITTHAMPTQEKKSFTTSCA